jgi:hypothetical protein
LPYPWISETASASTVCGCIPQATIALVNLIRAGPQIDNFEATTFDLTTPTKPSRTASNSGPFKMTVIRP